jgi:hypothetical protein
VERVFAVNLTNIKAAVEARVQGRPYVRPFAWEARHAWDSAEAER